LKILVAFTPISVTDSISTSHWLCSTWFSFVIGLGFDRAEISFFAAGHETFGDGF
jgi:hypothetical protein